MILRWLIYCVIISAVTSTLTARLDNSPNITLAEYSNGSITRRSLLPVRHFNGANDFLRGVAVIEYRGLSTTSRLGLWKSSCSGALIRNPHMHDLHYYVLTAAHCLYIQHLTGRERKFIFTFGGIDNNNPYVPVDRIRIRFGVTRGNRRRGIRRKINLGPTCRVQEYFVRSNYVNTLDQANFMDRYDLAVIKLRCDPHAVMPPAFDVSPFPPSNPAEILFSRAGYGLTLTLSQFTVHRKISLHFPKIGARHNSGNPMQHVNGLSVWSDEKNTPQERYMLYSDKTSRLGDSGGPVFDQNPPHAIRAVCSGSKGNEDRHVKIRPAYWRAIKNVMINPDSVFWIRRRA
eukprot:291344_1